MKFSFLQIDSRGELVETATGNLEFGSQCFWKCIFTISRKVHPGGIHPVKYLLLRFLPVQEHFSLVDILLWNNLSYSSSSRVAFLVWTKERTDPVILEVTRWATSHSGPSSQLFSKQAAKNVNNPTELSFCFSSQIFVTKVEAQPSNTIICLKSTHFLLGDITKITWRNRRCQSK